MEKDLLANLEHTYGLIRKEFPNVAIDSFDVVRQVEEYRQFWRPEKVNVILLAESHVYTDKNDIGRRCTQSILQKNLPNYPTPFVRFVYCLGYGEDALLTETATGRKNSGTPQFWKIFSSCVSDNPNDLCFYKVLKTGTPSLSNRVRNKIEILRKMKEKGIWLLDSSIVGLYGNKIKQDPGVYAGIINICWNNYVGKLVEATKPKFVIIIGKGVEKIVKPNLKFPFESIDLPQARLSSKEQKANFRRYSEICSSITNGKIPPTLSPTIERTRKTSENEAIIKTNKQSKKSNNNIVANKLLSKGYCKAGKTEWIKTNHKVIVISSVDFGHKVRVTWREKWKDAYAVIFDYSEANGPICIVPISKLFKTKFVEEKRQSNAYVNSGYWWTQKFPEEHELPQLVFSFSNQWTIL
jgi:hypothetical protein